MRIRKYPCHPLNYLWKAWYIGMWTFERTSSKISYRFFWRVVLSRVFWSLVQRFLTGFFDVLYFPEFFGQCLYGDKCSIAFRFDEFFWTLEFLAIFWQVFSISQLSTNPVRWNIIFNSRLRTRWKGTLWTSLSRLFLDSLSSSRKYTRSGHQRISWLGSPG